MDTLTTESTGSEEPLYVRVPGYLQSWLAEVKGATGLHKGDTVTLLLAIAERFFTPEALRELQDEYLLLGPEGITVEQLSNLIRKDI